MPSDPWLWLMQANDSQYPSGAYAHSYGLEELVEAAVVTDAPSLERFLETQVIPALLNFDLPWFTLAHHAAIEEDSARLLELDSELDAWRLPAETRDASRRIGSRRLELLRQLAPSPLVETHHAARPFSHHLIVTAIELATLPAAIAARAFAFQTISGFATASMKLMRLGQSACQAIVRRSLDRVGSELDTALSQPPDGWFNPLLEIASLRHARAHARLFIS
ncbi:MAG: urease accessory protein UreF [Verrucomicrobia bacterium]|nr:MAG: urease accessory protein UreF [Verrucomicrobiota bacterium]TAE87056.1 MAG: urease accessory protein UreF [Verrucomicrobiota bacterium]TAF24837.1 MAG: urease accessory protein UreF [Verrucomicrobiota bacterium]TAF40605.1 MAG: urease accessory protein UreF [Verrucomicrobiota bacterium]